MRSNTITTVHIHVRWIIQALRILTWIILCCVGGGYLRFSKTEIAELNTYGLCIENKMYRFAPETKPGISNLSITLALC